MQTDRIIRMKELIAITGLCRSTILNWEKTGKFPPRATVLPVGTAGWLESDIQKWMRGEKE